MANRTYPHTPVGRARQDGDRLVGRVIADRYRIERAIGQGGMGVVYEAVHVGLDKRVAIKFIAEKYTEDDDAVARFHREARAASRIGHDNIVDATDVGETEEGRCFIVMELLEGIDLAELLRQSGPMAAPRALAIADQILRGLSAAHDKGIVHRDMKPENVFLARRGGRDDVVKIMDFGISKFIAAHDSKVRLTETGAIMGTPVYMAPEQAQASPDIDHRADVYAVGVMLYEMLAGRPPFNAPSYVALVTQHIGMAPPPLTGFRPDLPSAIAAVVHRALEKDPARRFADCAEFAAALPSADGLAALLDSHATLGVAGHEVQAHALAATPAPASATARRRPWPWLAVGATGLAVIAAAAIAMIAADPGGEAAASGAEADAAAELATTEPIVTPGLPADAADAAAPEPPAATSILEIDSVPTGATVLFDDVAAGTTPLRLDAVALGSHRIRLEKAGFTALEAVKNVRAGRVESFTAALSAAPRGSSDRRRPEPTVLERPDDAAATASTPDPRAPATGPRDRDSDRDSDRDRDSDSDSDRSARPRDRKPNPYLK